MIRRDLTVEARGVERSLPSAFDRFAETLLRLPDRRAKLLRVDAYAYVVIARRARRRRGRIWSIIKGMRSDSRLLLA